MPATDIDTLARLADCRSRVLARQPVSPTEYRDLIDTLRQGREASAREARSTTARARRASTTPATVTVDLDTMFSTQETEQ